MAKPKGGLGRGLSSLLPDYEDYIEKSAEKTGEMVQELKIEDIMNVPGIGEAKFNAIKDLICV